MNQIAVRSPESTYLIPKALKDVYMKTVFNGLTEDEAVVAYRLAKRRNLDVEAKQIFFVPYTDKQGRRTVVSQTSIDGFRLIAAKSGKYGGSIAPKLTVKFKDGTKAVIQHEEYDPSETERIISGTISVINTDFPQPQSATALFDSYCKKYNSNPSGLWATMPDVMILKCAEALALRKAFPQDLSGIYTSDEMEQARNEDSFQAATVEQVKPSLNKFKPKAKQVVSTPQVVAVEAQAEEPANTEKAEIAETVAEYVAKIPDRLKQMNPDIDPDAIEMCRIQLMDHFSVADPSEIPEDRYDEIRDYMRTEVVKLLKTYGFIE